MAAYKKKPSRKTEPDSGKNISRNISDHYYSEHPAWAFVDIDQEQWAFSKDAIGEAFWTEILPLLRNLETQTWQEILIKSSKQHHAIDVRNLNQIAISRLNELHIEAESIISLRASATHRVYGYMDGHIFNILWYDRNHGDNDSCVCRSKKKHT